MNHPLVSLGVILVVGLFLVAYHFGFSTGRHVGQKKGQEEGHEEGKKEGRKEESIRAFAVGYDRGKRDHASEKAKQRKSPRGWTLLAVVVVTIFALSLLSRYLQRG